MTKLFFALPLAAPCLYLLYKYLRRSKKKSSGGRYRRPILTDPVANEDIFNL